MCPSRRRRCRALPRSGHHAALTHGIVAIHTTAASPRDVLTFLVSSLFSTFMHEDLRSCQGYLLTIRDVCRFPCELRVFGRVISVCYPVE